MFRSGRIRRAGNGAHRSFANGAIHARRCPPQRDAAGTLFAAALAAAAKLCPPSYGALRVKPFDRLGVDLLARWSGGARSHTQRSVSPRSIGAGLGFREIAAITASPHIRSDRAGPYPHSACLRRRKPREMGPIYESGCRLTPRAARSPSIPLPTAAMPQRRRVKFEFRYAITAPSGTRPLVR